MNKINTKSWIAMHPYDEITYIDSGYLIIANEIYSTVSHYLKEITHISSVEVEWISCCLTAYLEDRISGLNIFRTLNKLHYSLYNKQMPFYRFDSRYDPEGLNACDISFVIWNCTQQIQIYKNRSEIISPYNTHITNLTSKIYTRFRRVVSKKEADVNFALRTYYYMADMNSPYAILERIHSLKTRTYLFSDYDDFLRFRENGAMVASRPCEEIDSYVMFGIYPHQWYAHMLGFYKKEYKDIIDQIELLSLDSYVFKSNIDDTQCFESVAGDRILNIDLSKSIDPQKLVPDTHYLHSTLIRINNNWNLIPPVQITRSPETSLRQLADHSEPSDVYLIKNMNVRLNSLFTKLDIKCFSSLDDLIDFFVDERVRDELRSEFADNSENNFVLYPKSESAVYIIESIAPFIAGDKNELYDAEYTQQYLKHYMENASSEMKKIIIDMILRRLIVDFADFDDEYTNVIIKENIPFIASYFLQHICNDK
ncbi:MAG: DUF3843 family protein [Bacteroidales bacterium]